MEATHRREAHARLEGTSGELGAGYRQVERELEMQPGVLATDRHDRGE